MTEYDKELQTGTDEYEKAMEPKRADDEHDDEKERVEEDEQSD